MGGSERTRTPPRPCPLSLASCPPPPLSTTSGTPCTSPPSLPPQGRAGQRDQPASRGCRPPLRAPSPGCGRAGMETRAAAKGEREVRRAAWEGGGGALSPPLTRATASLGCLLRTRCPAGLRLLSKEMLRPCSSSLPTSPSMLRMARERQPSTWQCAAARWQRCRRCWRLAPACASQQGHTSASSPCTWQHASAPQPMLRPSSRRCWQRGQP